MTNYEYVVSLNLEEFGRFFTVFVGNLVSRFSGKPIETCQEDLREPIRQWLAWEVTDD